MALHNVAEGKLRIVKSIHELAHVLDALADGGSVRCKVRGRKIAAHDPLMHGLARQVAALQREQDPAAEDRIEKRERIAQQQQPRRGAVPRIPRVFARDEILACAFAGAEVILDPQVLLHLAVKNLTRLFHAAPREIFPLGDHTHAHHVAVLRNVPEPAFLGNHRDRRLPLVNPRLALRAAVIGPHGDLVELRIGNAPAELVRRERLLARTVERDARAHLVCAARAAVGRLDAGHAITFHQQPVHRRLLANLRAFFARIVEHHLVELRAQHLPCLRDGFAVVAVEKIERLRAPPVGLHKAHAVFFHKVRRPHLWDHPDAFQRAEGERDE